ncbi:MAG: helix-turn-helix domain-containing protein [Elusimicrobiota bacterium]
MKEFNKIIKDGIEKEGISLRELGRRSDLDVSFLSKILNGKRNPPREEKDLRKIAKSLKITPERLIIAAGRIPKNLRHIFLKEEFIDKLLEEKAPEKIMENTDKREETSTRDSKDKQYFSKDIEDELL